MDHPLSRLPAPCTRQVAPVYPTVRQTHTVYGKVAVIGHVIAVTILVDLVTRAVAPRKREIGEI